MSWVLGSWESTNKEPLITESWVQVSDMTFEGVGETYSEGKIKNTESLRIVEMSKAFFYIAKVDQNSSPVAFKLIQCEHGNAVFENLSHDFPKRIEYKLIEKDNMVVIVSDGKAKGFTIDFVRSNTSSVN